MSEFIRTITNVATGEITVVPFTEEEIATHLAEQQKMAVEQQILISEAETKQNERQALLNKLGISEDEAKLLLS